MLSIYVLLNKCSMCLCYKTNRKLFAAMMASKGTSEKWGNNFASFFVNNIRDKCEQHTDDSKAQLHPQTRNDSYCWRFDIMRKRFEKTISEKNIFIFFFGTLKRNHLENIELPSLWAVHIMTGDWKPKFAICSLRFKGLSICRASNENSTANRQRKNFTCDMHWKFAIRKIYEPSGKKIEWFTASALEEIILNSLFIIYLCHSVIFSHFYQIRFQIFGVKRHKRQISETLTEVVIISFNAHRVLVKHFLIYYCSHPEYRRRGLLWCFLMLSYTYRFSMGRWEFEKFFRNWKPFSWTSGVPHDISYAAKWTKAIVYLSISCVLVHINYE